ncbi:ATP-binding cassette domain-containing protein [Desulforhopalus sp. IMCC35007]|uniref:ATP-binding cassette domain-containing protein n=1 Tax=Desulforhopalus sp. IMCC35007 TaxID=2569543 RepID=UPI0010AE1231|nr:ATP-binding cassette domain-containing protein [Desulforhopalus sp. IMCC35007]TKB09974.1 ATP-binding cassette domain-containing protein [Desulforhopalus sp. IMCC35007]
MYIKNLIHPGLTIGQLQAKSNQSWCFWGNNSSGIDTFLLLLQGRLKGFSATRLELVEKPGVLSFQGQQELFEEELRNDDSDFMDRPDPGTSAGEFLGTSVKTKGVQALLKAFNIEQCLSTGIRYLSSGQSRKLIMLREVIRGSQTIILQNPYDGLDLESCAELNRALQHLKKNGICLIILVNSIKDIPGWCSHLGIFSQRQLTHAGQREEMLTYLQSTSSCKATEPAPFAVQRKRSDPAQSPRDELIRLKNGFAGYGESLLFTGLNLEIFTGDHTLIYGANGCGKSTLLDIFTGDNSKCYANDLRLFGQKRGGGESIWQIKQQMGIVSPSLHRDHRVPCSALHVVLSGLFDSIGLYSKVNSTQIREAQLWLDWIELSPLADKPFRRLPFAQQRLILIARALIKKPRLLVFDEATQGLDDDNRNKLLDLLEKIAENNLSTILFVSHRTDEFRMFFKQKIKLDDYTVNTKTPRQKACTTAGRIQQQLPGGSR